jgi:3-deoxy-manno-octulosonate cytidylyltransferase (CMP-KDO synthetase)
MIAGKSLVQRVYEQAAKANLLDRVVVATEDTRILEAVEAFGGDAMLTSVDCATGTDRIAEVALQHDYGLVLNIQGDEPLMRPEMIDQLIEGMQANPDCVMGTHATEMRYTFRGARSRTFGTRIAARRWNGCAWPRSTNTWGFTRFGRNFC